MGRVLIVDDERSMREFLTICLERESHQVSTASSADDAIAVLATDSFDVVITDMQMPGSRTGLDLLQHVREKEYETEVIVVTAFATTETAIQAMRQGAYDYLTKPFKVDEINAVVGRAVERRTLLAENVALKEQVQGRSGISGVLGKSDPMQKLFSLIEKIKDTPTTVLVTGESGTGKELIARALHTEGAFAKGPFIAINCGAIPEALLESELFGHVKGAFTGATADKDGMFTAAAGGTLFLDEIGELPSAMQVKLLRALQERKVRPVGANHEVDINVRVVAATNRDLAREVENGAFRQDLYYRLNVIELVVPPLRQRKEDIPMLVAHFVDRYKTLMGKEIESVAPTFMAWLTDYEYPGNVRELENIIERAVTLNDGHTLSTQNLPSVQPPTASPTELPDDGLDLDRALAELERALLEKAIQRCDGDRGQIAKLLRINARSLRYRLQKHSLVTK